MKKKIVLILSVLAMACLFGCGKKPAQNESSAPTENELLTEAVKTTGELVILRESENYKLTGIILAGEDHLITEDFNIDKAVFDTKNLQTEFGLDESIYIYTDGVYLVREHFLRVFMIPHVSESELRELTEAELSEMQAFSGAETSFYELPELEDAGKREKITDKVSSAKHEPGLYDLVFTDDGKPAMYVVIALTGEPEEAVDSAKTVSREAVVEGSIFGGESSSRIPLTFTFNPEWLTKNDPKAYNAELAKCAVVLCADSYYREKDLAKNTQNRVVIANEEYAVNGLLTSLGFTDTLHVETYKDSSYTTDLNDSATLNLGYLETEQNDVFVAVIRGSFSAGEWGSAFDPGEDSGAYAILTGEHPDWEHRHIFKGMDVAAKRAMKAIEDFIAKNDRPEKANSILITGHSRGGAVANLVGENFGNRKDFRAYTYTFNAPASVPEEENYPCTGIFNLFDAGDFYTETMPFAGTDYVRYGTDCMVDFQANDEAEAALKELTCGVHETMSEEDRTEYERLFRAYFGAVEDIYEMKTITTEYKDYTEADQARNALIEKIGAAGLNLEPFARVELPGDDGPDKTVKFSFCKAALLTGIARTLSYGNSAADAVKEVFAEEKDGLQVIDFLLNHSETIGGGHLLAADYVLADYVTP